MTDLVRHHPCKLFGRLTVIDQAGIDEKMVIGKGERVNVIVLDKMDLDRRVCNAIGGAESVLDRIQAIEDRIRADFFMAGACRFENNIAKFVLFFTGHLLDMKLLDKIETGK